ncbi:hypothetical protein MVEN_02266300 [Mycena venus]|uniref:RRM domain-containing protein n=1 Tax=Mycena venus TaxID=2733690 RepID=A0A8H7CE86_9AGAR|nr:hypothetical protein MVEN_02266300 [Mycena venus]
MLQAAGTATAKIAREIMTATRIGTAKGIVTETVKETDATETVTAETPVSLCHFSDSFFPTDTVQDVPAVADAAEATTGSRTAETANGASALGPARARASRRRSASPRRRSRRSRSRTRSRSPRSRSRSRSRDRRGKSSDTFARSLGGPMNADHEEAVEFAKVSKREHRVYVGNLSYEVRYRDLMEFMRGAGEVLFAEVLVTPTGVSKGCGIVEFASQEDAQRAVRELSELPLLGRPVFIREVRPRNRGALRRDTCPRQDWRSDGWAGSQRSAPPRVLPRTTTLARSRTRAISSTSATYLPYQAGWQDLKDLFRVAGNIVRADINLGADGRPKGSGTVVFETPKDAQAAISMYHGTDWYGRTLEVREDRYADLSGAGGLPRRVPRRTARARAWGTRARRRVPRGLPGWRVRRRRGRATFSNQDLYADYSGPDQGGAYGGGHGGGYGAHGGAHHGAGFAGPGGAGYVEPEPSQQIMVRNVRAPNFLPTFSGFPSLILAHLSSYRGRRRTRDLVELFETTGQVELAEILFDGARSKGCGVVQFAQVGEAETAIAKFQQYMYGGRPLDVRFQRPLAHIHAHICQGRAAWCRAGGYGVVRLRLFFFFLLSHPPEIQTQAEKRSDCVVCLYISYRMVKTPSYSLKIKHWQN